MSRIKKQEPLAIEAEVTSLPNDKKLQDRFCLGERLESPLGGFLEPLAANSLDDGSGRILLECNASSLRYELIIRKGTRTERDRVRDQLSSGREPRCPRNESQVLVRRGAELVCPRCQVKYGKAP